MLEASSFDFRNRHPQPLMVKLEKHYGLEKHSAVTKIAHLISLDLYRTFAPLKQNTATMAFACLELSGRLHGQEKEKGMRNICEGRDYKRWAIERDTVMGMPSQRALLETYDRTSISIIPCRNISTHDIQVRDRNNANTIGDNNRNPPRCPRTVYPPPTSNLRRTPLQPRHLPRYKNTIERRTREKKNIPIYRVCRRITNEEGGSDRLCSGLHEWSGTNSYTEWTSERKSKGEPNESCYTEYTWNATESRRKRQRRDYQVYAQSGQRTRRERDRGKLCSSHGVHCREKVKKKLYIMYENTAAQDCIQVGEAGEVV